MVPMTTDKLLDTVVKHSAWPIGFTGTFSNAITHHLSIMQHVLPVSYYLP